MHFQVPGWLSRMSLACALCSLAAVASTARDVTFVHISDQHYSADRESHDVLVATIRAINDLPGTDYPAEFGGTVGSPRGIVLTGDLTNDGTPEDWQLFEAHWGLTGKEGLIRFPVYEGAGNHDGGPASAGHEGRGYVRRQIVERNKRRPGIRRLSDPGLHYSWDWDDVHFVCLNEYPGQEDDTRYPGNVAYGRKRQAYGNPAEKSLQFLSEDLATAVGDSGRPIILMQHYGFDGFAFHPWGEEAAWWTEEHALRLWEAIEGYNVIAILAGHDGSEAVFEWHGIPNRHMDDAVRFGVYRIRDDEMTVSIRNARSGRWERTWKQSTRIESSLPPELKQGPYLIYPDDPTKMTVCWRTATGIPCKLRWGDDQFCYEDGAVEVEPYDAERGLYRYTLAGLAPGTSVNYVLEIDGKYAPGMFYTPAATADKVKFLVADAPVETEDRDRLFQAMYELVYRDPAYHSFILHPSRIVSQPGALTAWDEELFSRRTTARHVRYMLTRSPLMSLRSAGELARKLLPYDRDPGAPGYSFDYGPIHMVILGSGADVTPGSPEATWLRNELVSANARWKMVSISSSGGPPGDGRLAAPLRLLLDESGVDVCLTGGRPFSHTQHGGMNCITVGPAPDGVQAGALLGVQVEGAALTCELFNSKGKAVRTFTFRKADPAPSD